MWLRQPLVSLSKITRRHNAVSKLVDDTIGRDRLRDEGLNAFRGVDIDKLSYRLIADGRAATEYTENRGGGVSNTSKSLENLYKLHLVGDKCLPPLLEVMQSLLESNGDQTGENEEDACALRAAYEGLNTACTELQKAVGLAEKVIDFDHAPRDFIVKKDLDEDLHDVKSELDGIEDELEAIHAEMNSIWHEETGKGNNQVRLENVDDNSNTTCVWQFRVPDTNAGKYFDNELKDYDDIVVHRILKNGVYFSNKALQQLGTKKKDLMAEYEDKQRSIVNQCMTVASTFTPVLERCSVLLSELDVLASFAHVAAYSPRGYCRPEMTDGEDDGLGIVVSNNHLPCLIFISMFRF